MKARAFVANALIWFPVFHRLTNHENRMEKSLMYMSINILFITFRSKRKRAVRWVLMYTNNQGVFISTIICVYVYRQWLQTEMILARCLRILVANDHPTSSEFIWIEYSLQFHLWFSACQRYVILLYLLHVRRSDEDLLSFRQIPTCSIILIMHACTAFSVVALAFGRKYFIKPFTKSI